MSKPKSTWSAEQRRRFKATMRRKKLAKAAAAKQTNGGAASPEERAALELLEILRASAEGSLTRINKAIASLQE